MHKSIILTYLNIIMKNIITEYLIEKEVDNDKY